jgi:hypothetical protein
MPKAQLRGDGPAPKEPTPEAEPEQSQRQSPQWTSPLPGGRACSDPTPSANAVVQRQSQRRMEGGHPVRIRTPSANARHQVHQANANGSLGMRKS